MAIRTRTSAEIEASRAEGLNAARQADAVHALMVTRTFAHLCRTEPVGAGLYALVCPCGYRSEPNYREALGHVCPALAAQLADEGGR